MIVKVAIVSRPNYAPGFPLISSTAKGHCHDESAEESAAAAQTVSVVEMGLVGWRLVGLIASGRERL